MKRFNNGILTFALAGMAAMVAATATAQVTASDSVFQHKKGNRLSVGGYGEVALTRNFYSDNVYRYRAATNSQYKDDPSHGRFDIPHAVIYLGYDFGKGWTFGTEIEFEHGGSGAAYEREYGEGGEYEKETERGGEVELEQFWIQKSFARWANIKVGHIVVPIGLTNAYHEPLNFFTVYRPEGENTIMPCTWHQTGISLWGRAGDWRYELQMVASLNALNFTTENWIKNGPKSAFEFDPASKYAFAARIDNYSIPGLRIGLSGYYGESINNQYTNSTSDKVKNLKGAVAIGAIDFTYKGYNWIARGNFDYGHLSDAAAVNSLPDRGNTMAPYHDGDVGKNAVAASIEAGYDIFSQINKLREDNQKLYLFGHYEYYNSYVPSIEINNYEYTKKHRMAVGVNYYPVPQVAVKAEYSKRFLKSGYYDEPSVSIGVAYEGFFL